MDRATASEAVGRGFDSLRSHQFLVHQCLFIFFAWRSLVARLSGGQEVAGSIPVAETMFFVFGEVPEWLKGLAC